MSKIIFLDLDGTLLNDQKEITDGNRVAIAEAVKAGHKVVIATGRTLSSAIKLADVLGMNALGCYLIAGNGANIYDIGAQRLLFESTIPLKLVLQIFAEANRRGIHIQTYDERGVIVEPHNNDDDVKIYCKRSCINHVVLDHIEDLKDRPVKLLLIDFKDQQPLLEFRDWIRDEYQGQLDSYLSCNEYLEVVNAGINKAAAIGRLCNLLKISFENTLAVGDAANDLEMLKCVHLGAAMANATEEVKKISGYITQRDNNHDGVAEVIAKFMLS